MYINMICFIALKVSGQHYIFLLLALEIHNKKVVSALRISKALHQIVLTTSA